MRELRSQRPTVARKRRRPNIAIACALALGALTAIGPGKADAGDVSIGLSQSTDLAWDGQDILVEITGTADTAFNILAVCPTALVASGEEFDIGTCTQLDFEAPAPPFTRTFNVRHDTHPSCETNECSISYISVLGFPPADVEIFFEPLAFAPPPPVPPTDPGFAITVDPVDDRGNELDVDVTVVNRNPATISATLSLCPAEILVDDVPAACALLQTFNANVDANADIATTLTLARQGIPGRNCGIDPCALVYRSMGTATRPVTEFLKQPIDFTPPSAIISVTGNTDLPSGRPLTVAWETQRSGQIPSDREIEGPANYVGLCLGDVASELPYSDLVCQGSDVGPAEFAGELDLSGERFITTERDGVVDCLAYAAGCVVGYSLSYVDVDNNQEIVLLDRDDRPLAFRQSVTVNFGNPVAGAGDPVHVSSFGTPTGVAGFLMMCAVGDRGRFDLRCSNDIGTVRAPFTGAFSGSITMPLAIDVDGENFDCTVGRGCLVVLAVITDDLRLVFGSGVWIRALDDFAITVTPSTNLDPAGATVRVDTVNARNNFATVLMLCPNDVQIPQVLGEISGRCTVLAQWLQTAPLSAVVVVEGNADPRCAVVGCSMVWATFGSGFQLTAAASAPVTFAF